jgi:hypothetical protein
VFEHNAGVLDGHLAGQERCHVLHRGRVTDALFQTQAGIGGDAPFVAAFAVAAGPFDRDRTKTRLEGARVIGGKGG